MSSHTSSQRQDNARTKACNCSRATEGAYGIAKSRFMCPTGRSYVRCGPGLSGSEGLGESSLPPKTPAPCLCSKAPPPSLHTMLVGKGSGRLAWQGPTLFPPHRMGWERQLRPSMARPCPPFLHGQAGQEVQWGQQFFRIWGGLGRWYCRGGLAAHWAFPSQRNCLPRGKLLLQCHLPSPSPPPL